MPSSDGAAYDGFADTFAREASTSAYNAHYDRPTVLGLLGDLDGRHVLDAGCGPGLYLDALLAGGATVVGCDQSADMVRAARDRVGDRVPVRQHDLDAPFDWADDNTFDIVLVALVIHYVHDRVATLAELRRLLRPGGRIIVSTSHPTADWIAAGGSYFEAGHVEETWSGGMTHRYWRQPLQAWLDDFAAAGLALERLVEHQPALSMAHEHPTTYGKLAREPGFIAYRLAASLPASA
ncbi:class I SAM-dependent methyltransferase [Streptomyces sp. NPDC093111]|uniref:class I SAM-dependent methyltransferase n=1 Tax=Streptomyces sp. NPDC093111 TaxID=3154978 RepID=UPI003447B6C9